MVEEIDTVGPGGMEHIFREHWDRAREIALEGAPALTGGFTAFTGG